VFAADEYYLLCGRPFPEAEAYEGFPQHENGIGIARSFEAAFLGDASRAHGARAGFFAWVDGAPAAGYRAPRGGSCGPGPWDAAGDERRERPVAILTGEYGAAVIEPLLARLPGLGGGEVRVVAVRNELFGGNIAVAGLLGGADVARALAREPAATRYLLPDVCLSQGRFLDGLAPADLPREVEVVASDGLSLRRALLGPGEGQGALQ